MRPLKSITSALVLAILLSGLNASAQTEITDQSTTNVDFYLLYSSLELALDTWDDLKTPDTVMLDAYKVASGYLAGISFHYERNRDRLTLFEQIDVVSTELEYTGHRSEGTGYYVFTFNLPVPFGTYNANRQGENVSAHGVSDLEDLAAARKEARNLAFEEAARGAMRASFSGQNQVIPGVVDGRITWYDIERDERDLENGCYIFDIETWVKFDED